MRASRQSVASTAVARVLSATLIACLSPFVLGNEAPRTLESVGEILTLSPQEAEASFPVSVAGVVTHIDHEWNHLFLTEGNRGIFVTAPAEQLRGISFGDHVALAGRARPGEISPIIVGSEITELAPSPLPEPLRLGSHHLDQLDGLDACWVEVSGLVIGAHLTNDRSGWKLALGPHTVEVVSTRTLPEEWQGRALMGQHVTLRGHAHLRQDSQGQPVGLNVLLQGHEQAHILQNSPIDIEAYRNLQITISELRSPHTPIRQLALLSGWVTFVENANACFMEDDSGAIKLRLPAATPLEIGDRIEALVLPSHPPTTQLDAINVSKAGPGPAPTPRSLTPKDVVNKRLEGLFVNLQGHFVSQITTEHYIILTLSKEGVIFHAYLNKDAFSKEETWLGPPGESSSSMWSSVPLLSVSGICLESSPHSANPAAFRLLVPSPDCLTRIHEPPTWPLRILLSILGLLVLAAIASLLWVITLRKQVRSQTASLEQRTRELARSREELANLMALLQASSDAARDAIAIVSLNGKAIEINRRWESILGAGASLASLQSQDLGEYLSPFFEDPQAFHRWWKEYPQDSAKKGLKCWTLGSSSPGASEREVQVFTAPVRGADGEIMGRLWSCEDISERRQLERSLLQAQKMEAVGRLAGGIAHDFNNLLTGIAGNLAVLKLNQAHPIKEHLQLVDSAEAAARRAAELVKQMLGFSRQNTLRLQSTDVNAVVKELVQLLRHSFEKTIELHQDLASDLWSVKADATHIEQVLMNICVNARDAMSGRTGTITIGTENLDSVADRDSKPYVVITIADSGSGMPEEIRNKIFEPFFTTKEAGKGTGLGLSMSYGIIEQHHGWIECASQEGDGTTFRIYLPKGATQSPRKPRTVISPTKGLKGSEQILVVDDEAVVRAVAQGVLRHNGYRVLTAGDGKEALDTIAQRRSEIDLVLLDLTMPRMTGKEAFRRIKESHPDLPVIICSGYLVDLDGFSEEAGAIPEGFVQKPYEMHQLLTSIRQTLGPGVELQDADTESTLTTDEAA